MRAALYSREVGLIKGRRTARETTSLSRPIASTYPGFVEAGLITLVDAAEIRSYPGSGTTWFDLSGNGRNFTLENSPTWSPNDGGYISFGGSPQRAVCAYSDGMNATDWTMVMWVYLLTNPANLDTLISRGYPPTINYYIDCRSVFQTGSYSDLGVNRDPYVRSTTTCNSIVGSWRMLTSRWDSTNMAVFVNATKETEAARLWGGNTSTSELTIGALRINTSYSRYTDMRVGLACVYNRPLTDTEVATNFEATRWRFGQ